jgi:hypothetical protein
MMQAFGPPHLSMHACLALTAAISGPSHFFSCFPAGRGAHTRHVGCLAGFCVVHVAMTKHERFDVSANLRCRRERAEVCGQIGMACTCRDRQRA